MGVTPQLTRSQNRMANRLNLARKSVIAALGKVLKAAGVHGLGTLTGAVLESNQSEA